MGRLMDKLLALLVMAPPLYMLFRFIRWWLKQEAKPEPDTAKETKAE